MKLASIGATGGTQRTAPGHPVIGGGLAQGAGRGDRGQRHGSGSRGEMRGSTRLALTDQTVAGSRRAALFASELQPSDTPTGDMITSAITSTLRRFGGRGCTERMAQEFGDHPDAAAERMRWARRVAA